MNVKNLLFLFVFAGVAIWGWQHSAVSLLELFPKDNARAAAEAASRAKQATLTVKDLPCFECHIYDDFAKEPVAGAFSHTWHMQFEYHCNQCHSFHGHREMVVNTEVCRSCH